MRCLRCWSSASRGPWPALAQSGLAALALLAPVLATADDASRFAVGNDHFYNRELDEAARWFEAVVEREPDDPAARMHLAKTLVLIELERLGMIGTGAFGDDEEFNDIEKPKPDPQAGAAIRQELATARALCERRLKADPGDREGLHVLAQTLALRASFDFLVARAYFKALASGRRARTVSYGLAELHPEFVDGVLVAGVDEYVVGSLPWAARALIALSGYRGRKKKGAEIIARVAREGRQSRVDARLLLGLIYRRERRLAEAAEVFESLANDFPRAYTYALEHGAMRRAADDKAKALEVFREVERKRAAGEQRYDRMSARYAAALGRRIEGLEEDLARDGAR